MSETTSASGNARHFKWTKSDDGMSITYTAVGIPGTPSKTLRVSDVDEKLRPKLLQYGLIQFVQDRVAQLKTTAEKAAGIDETFDNLVAGIWSERTASDKGSASVEALKAAISRAYKKTPDQVTALFTKKAASLEDAAYKKWLKGLPEDPKVAAAIAEIAMEKAREAAKLARQHKEPTSLAGDFEDEASQEAA